MTVTPETPMTSTEMNLIRTSHGLSLADLAVILDVSERTLRRWESGTPIPEGVAVEMLRLEGTVEDLSDIIAAEYRKALATGLWSVDVPVIQAEIADPELPLSLWQAGAARAAERYGVRLTSPRDQT